MQKKARVRQFDHSSLLSCTFCEATYGQRWQRSVLGAFSKPYWRQSGTLSAQIGSILGDCSGFAEPYLRKLGALRPYRKPKSEGPGVVKTDLTYLSWFHYSYIPLRNIVPTRNVSCRAEAATGPGRTRRQRARAHGGGGGVEHSPTPQWLIFLGARRVPGACVRGISGDDGRPIGFCAGRRRKIIFRSRPVRNPNGKKNGPINQKCTRFGKSLSDRIVSRDGGGKSLSDRILSRDVAGSPKPLSMSWSYATSGVAQDGYHCHICMHHPSGVAEKTDYRSSGCTLGRPSAHIGCALEASAREALEAFLQRC